MEETKAATLDRLLLVDDNPTNLQVLFEALEAEGYELLVAQSGEEAIATAKVAQPHLILLDINMPGMDGYETCRRLKDDVATRDAVVVFLSARGNVDDKVQGLELGAVDYIGKPFQFEEVVARVRKHLETYHRHADLQYRTEALEEELAGGFRNLSAEALRQFVADGEGERAEFKSTLRWNLHTQKPDKRIENACLKTVAAYLNTSGGTLLVGVDDQGETLGLDSDDFANEDKLLLHWNGLMKAYLGVEIASLVRSTIRDLNDKRVLVVQCLASPHPVFLSRDNDETFFVRSGNGTQPLKPSQILSYLRQRSEEPPAGAPGTLGKGERFGQYAVDERIGAGAMGVVFRGHHEMLHRPAAIKQLDPHRADQRTIARFEREVQLTAQLNHPNTIAIYDYGRTPEGSFYYVMEYLDGYNLGELVKQFGPLPEGRVVNILEQLCGSLAEAHGVGLIHRDIKPSNAMLNRRGGICDFVKLLDFGLVKDVDASEQMALTAPGVITGTPLYLSPEAVQNPDTLDARSDLYSLGAVGYFLLVGRPVFEGTTMLELCAQHTSREPTPLSKRLAEPLSPDLEALLLQCLAKKPEQRPQSAIQLRDGLANCRVGAPWSDSNAEAWWDKHAR